jgi:hypothetical protein
MPASQLRYIIIRQDIYICYYYDSNKKCYDALVIFGEQASLLACLDLDNMSRYALYIASSM